MKPRLFLAALFSLSVAPAALADSGVDAEFTFGDELVPGDHHSSTAEHLVVRSGRQRSSLIQVRTEFVAPMLKSVEDI